MFGIDSEIDLRNLFRRHVQHVKQHMKLLGPRVGVFVRKQVFPWKKFVTHQFIKFEGRAAVNQKTATTKSRFMTF